MDKDYLNDQSQDFKISKLNEIFKKIASSWEIPDFCMWSRIIPKSKENNNTPSIENTRPIAILPSITKAFELSILGNLEKIDYENEHISKNQRGFTPRMNTCINLSNLFDFWFEAKTKIKEPKTK